jgi:hypothetical protein
MRETAADDLACHVIANYPLAHRLGIDDFSAELADRGMPVGESREVATLLFAFELMNRGASYNTVISHLELQLVSHGDALAGAIGASRIHRLAKRDEEIQPDYFLHFAAGVSTITIALLTIALFR